jgi:hypothetical protein
MPDVGELERLARLHNDGALTDAEFAQAKGALLSGAHSVGFALNEAVREGRKFKKVAVVFLAVLAAIALGVFLYLGLDIYHHATSRDW